VLLKHLVRAHSSAYVRLRMSNDGKCGVKNRNREQRVRKDARDREWHKYNGDNDYSTSSLF